MRFAELSMPGRTDRHEQRAFRNCLRSRHDIRFGNCHDVITMVLNSSVSWPVMHGS
jgi:hypothetical protein